MHHQPQSVGTQPEENYSLDSPMEKSEYGNHKEQPTKNEEINDIILFIILLLYIVIILTKPMVRIGGFFSYRLPDLIRRKGYVYILYHSI